jgi:hypothetical protein
VGQGIGGILKGRAIQDMPQNVGNELPTTQRHSTSQKTEDFKLQLGGSLKFRLFAWRVVAIKTIQRAKNLLVQNYINLFDCQ